MSSCNFRPWMWWQKYDVWFEKLEVEHSLNMMGETFKKPWSTWIVTLWAFQGHKNWKWRNKNIALSSLLPWTKIAGRDEQVLCHVLVRIFVLSFYTINLPWIGSSRQAPASFFLSATKRAKSEIRHHTAPKQHQFLANTGTRNLTYKLGWLTEGFGPDHSNVGSFKDFTIVEFSAGW